MNRPAVYTSGMMSTRLYVFHYHLLPGGVTSVISSGMEALIRHIPELREIVLVTGRTEYTAEITSQLREQADLLGHRDLKVNVLCMPKTGYAETLPPDRKTLETEAKTLAETLIQKLGGSPWWIHNYHIGKNPVLTRAIIRTAREAPEQKLYLQIHDFPESGRLQNLRGLADVTPLYPEGPNVHYLTINGRDRKILMDAGISENRVTLMINPVKSASSGRETSLNRKKEIRSSIAKIWGKEFPAYDPATPCAFYPVRSIRRKNILEAGLLPLLSEDNINLIVTLPGLSRQEVHYSNLVEGLFRRGIIPGLWGTGLAPAAGASDTIPGFREVAASCDIILSTSLQEGFGYLFVEAAGWGKRLFSRRLDILEEIIPLLEPGRCGTYDRLKVPFGGPLKVRTLKAYEAHTSGLRGFLPENIISRLAEDFSRLKTADFIDFSMLSVADQARFLESLREDSGLLTTCRALNRSVCGELQRVIEAGSMEPAPAEEQRIEEYFGLKAFAERVKNLFSAEKTGGEDLKHPPASPEECGRAVLEAFNTPYYHRLIFQPFEGDLT